MTEATQPKRATPAGLPDEARPTFRVLLIEDDKAQAAAVGRWLQLSGEFKVASADSGYSAAASLMSGVRWDLVISDIDLPGMNGLQLLALCKEYQPEAPVVLVTAHRKFDYALEAMRSRAADLLLKPLDRELLVSKARAVIATAKAERKKAQETVLAIGAHPDDVEIGCGGILLNHVRRGDRVVILTLSRGEAGGPQVERVQESRTAATALGARLRMANLPDREISEGPATISVIEEVLRDVDPTIVYTHSDRDAHQDHRAVHRASVVACRGVPNVYCYQAPSTTVEFRPALFVNVADHLERKLEILDIYRTQAAIRPYLKREQVRSTATYWGRFSDYEAVEPLEVVRRSA